MNDFNTLFPNFLNQCVQLNRALLPVAFVLLATGIISSTVTGQRSPSAYLRTFGRTLGFLAILAQLSVWGNLVSRVVDDTVKNTLQADPAGVHQQYQKALEIQKGSTANSSWWDKLFDGQAFFESLVSAAFQVLGILASAIVFYAYLVQKFVLYLGYALSPIFIGFLAVRTLQSIGVSYLLGLSGVMLWPLGWGAASIMTKGLIDFMSDQSFLSGGAVGAAGYTLQNLIGIGVLGIWLIFSTIAAPVILQKAVASGAQIGQALAAGAATAGVAAATTGASAAATLASGGGLPAAAAGIAVGAAAGGVALAGASMSGSTYSPSGSLLSSIASQRKPNRPATSDLSGDQAVRDLLKRN
jgi:hypothetical protein